MESTAKIRNKSTLSHPQKEKIKPENAAKIADVNGPKGILTTMDCITPVAIATLSP